MRPTSFILFFYLISLCPALAQSASELGWMPSVAISHTLSGPWKVTWQAESRQNFWNRSQGESYQTDYRYVRTDLTVNLSYKINPLWSVAGGYMLRFTEGTQVHRSLQQIAFTQRLPVLRLGHRLRTDQTFADGEVPEYRFRYRLSGEIPLKGESLNDREFYLKAGNEQVASIQAGSWDWEIRGVANLGYQINRRTKLETGIDYRVDRLINNSSRHRAWWTVGGYWSL